MFDEIKAKLGLDITDFERKIAKTQGTLRDLTESSVKRFTDIKQVGNTLATAIGLNIEKIAEGVARLIVGFSQDQEQALKKLVETSKSAADQLTQIAQKSQGADDPKKRLELLKREEASVRLAAQGRTKLTISEKLSIINQRNLIEGLAYISGQEEALATQVEEAQARLGQISRERLLAEREIKDKSDEKEKKDIEAIGKSFKAAADEREKRKFKELSIDEKIASKQAELADSRRAENDITKSSVQRSEAIAKSQKLQSEILDLQTERTKAITDAEEKLTEARRKNALGAASDAQKLIILNQDVADAQKAIVDAGTDQIKQAEAKTKLAQAEADLTNEKDRQSKQNAERIKSLIEDVASAEIKVLDAADDQNAAARAQIELQQARKKLSEEQAKITEKTANFSAIVNDAENKRAKAIAEKIDSLFGRAATLEKTLADAKRKAELPTMAEVASGQRDIGVRSREDAKKLEAEEAKIKKLSDNETRLKGQLEQAKTAGDRKNLIEEGRRNRAQLDAARARRDALLGGLAGKISDVPFAEQEKAAKEARDAAAKAQAEANKPKLAEAKPVIPPAAPELKPEAKPIVSPAVPEPKPAEAKPIVPPVSAAEAAATAAQNAVQTAQLKLTSTTGRGVGDMSGISSDLSSCVRILGDIKDRLESTSISTT